MKRVMPLLLVLCVLPLLALSGKDNDIERFREGISFYNEALYDFAVEKFIESRSSLAPIDDYVLLFLSRSYLALENNDLSISSASELIEKYPDSPLIPYARAVEIQSKMNSEFSTLAPLLASYLERYPNEDGMRLKYGQLLASNDQKEKAAEVLKQLYIKAGELEKEALSAVGMFELTDEEQLERAGNLLARARYPEVEQLVRELSRNEDMKDRTTEIHAKALFRQRKYFEAAGLFVQCDDLHNAARSYIRSGQMDEFYLTLDKMITTRHDQGGTLLVAYANDVRRDGDIETSLELLEDALAKFPEVKEDALWGKGWTLFMADRHLEATKIFTRLAGEYRNNQYAYWAARGMKHLGLDPSPALANITGTDYYSFLAKKITGINNTISFTPVENFSVSPPIERIDLLLAVGLNKEAADELMSLAQRTKDTDRLVAISSRLEKAERYRDAIRLLLFVPEDNRPSGILYPMAYWSEIKETSTQYDMDPFLLLSLIREESLFDPQAVSRVGAIGLMQLMPETAQRTARLLSLDLEGTEPLYEIELNIALGTHYLNGLLKDFGNVPAALAAYNAGRTRVKGWLKTGNYKHLDEFIEDIPYPETRNYVKRILTSYFYYHAYNGGLDEKGLNIL